MYGWFSGELTNMKHSRATGTKRGFTLIEVLGATVVLVVGLLAAFYLTAQGTAMNTDSKAVIAAHLAAQKQVETLRNTPWDSIAIGTRSFSPAATNLPSPTGTLTVVDHGDGSGQLKDATVVVGWKDRGGAARSVVVATTIGQGGMDPQ